MPVTSMALRTTPVGEAVAIMTKRCASDNRCRSFLADFLLERGKPDKPFVETFSGAGREGQVLNLRMNLASVFESELGIEFDVRKKVRLGQDHQRSAVENPGV